MLLLNRHNIRHVPSRRPGHYDDHLLIPFGENSQTATSSDFAGFYLDCLAILWGKYRQDDRVTAEDLYEERRKVNLPGYTPFSESYNTDMMIRPGIVVSGPG